MDPNFVRADNSNLPKIDAFTVAHFFKNNADYYAAEHLNITFDLFQNKCSTGGRGYLPGDLGRRALSGPRPPLVLGALGRSGSLRVDWGIKSAQATAPISSRVSSPASSREHSPAKENKIQVSSSSDDDASGSNNTIVVLDNEFERSFTLVEGKNKNRSMDIESSPEGSSTSKSPSSPSPFQAIQAPKPGTTSAQVVTDGAAKATATKLTAHPKSKAPPSLSISGNEQTLSRFPQTVHVCASITRKQSALLMMALKSHALTLRLSEVSTSTYLINNKVQFHTKALEEKRMLKPRECTRIRESEGKSSCVNCGQGHTANYRRFPKAPKFALKPRPNTKRPTQVPTAPLCDDRNFPALVAKNLTQSPGGALHPRLSLTRGGKISPRGPPRSGLGKPPRGDLLYFLLPLR
ncbi:hypothetical protein EVAR_86475_1 [Eumeta japonica]|uniref:Uncharacterized protein n=1 Tax=Eumeta variegata TaxID=151549 RepID=A0A4C1VQ66_EUMVA|nr:hypothetical protein EVAR_86475_1 [Eumeta japonica]